MNRSFCSNWNVRRASSLVTTLLVVVVLSVVAVAFFQAMNLERLMARSAANRVRADLVAHGGLEMVRRTIRAGIGSNYGYATVLTNLGSSLEPVLLISSSPGHQRTMPLVSGPLSSLFPHAATNPAMLSNFLVAASLTNRALAADANKKRGAWHLISEAAPGRRFNAPWIFLTDASGQTNARFCFFVTDEQAKLNLAIHGTSAVAHRAGWGLSADRIPDEIPGVTAFPGFSGDRPRLPSWPQLSRAVLGQAFASRSDFERTKHLFTLHDVPSASFIPAGRVDTNGSFAAYRDAHQPRYNINDLATNVLFGATATERAGHLARVIDTNLPGFKTRDRAMEVAGVPQIRYVERIAAAIVDYIDEDVVPTALADGEPAGKELAPLITAIAERYNWVSESGSGSEWTNEITHAVFVQMWNPYQTEITGEIGFELFTPTSGGRYRSISMPGAPQEALQTVHGTNTVTLRPNEHRVHPLGMATNIVISSVQGSLNTANHPRLEATASTNVLQPLHTRFRAFWNGVLFDHTPNESPIFDEQGPGLKKSEVGNSSGTRITLNGTNRFSINYPPTMSSGNGFRAVGDPRQNYLAAYTWETLSQTNSDVRWNGRNNNTSGATRQDYQTTWVLRDFVRENPPVGGFVGDDDPTSAPATWNPTVGSNAPAFFRNGPMRSIGELGNIYDPVHLNDAGFATRGGGPPSWYVSGGGRTLRFGQPELDYPGTNTPTSDERRTPSWAADDRRALSLADLFTTVPTNAFGIPESAGRVNLNTASREVLAALFWGLGQDADPAHSGSWMTVDGAFRVADEVIQGRPYYRMGDAHRFLTNLLDATNFSPQLGSAAVNPALLMDAGREQMLAGILEHLDCHSQVFHVVVIAEALDRRGRPSARSILQALLAVSFERDTDTGEIVCEVSPIHLQTE